MLLLEHMEGPCQNLATDSPQPGLQLLSLLSNSVPLRAGESCTAWHKWSLCPLQGVLLDRDGQDKK
jgi:hypothetical protein